MTSVINRAGSSLFNRGGFESATSLIRANDC